VPASNKPYAMTAKTRAIPGLHRDYSQLKYHDTARMLRQVTQPPFIAGPLAFMRSRLLDKLFIYKQISKVKNAQMLTAKALIYQKLTQLFN
jgi:hypothetical protein